MFAMIAWEEGFVIPGAGEVVEAVVAVVRVWEDPKWSVPV
jgi:hypothetical protein